MGSVGIGGRYTDRIRLLVDHKVNETGVLVTETVVVLPPNMRGGEQVVREAIDLRQGISLADVCSHLACWLNMESTMWMNACRNGKRSRGVR